MEWIRKLHSKQQNHCIGIWWNVFANCILNNKSIALEETVSFLSVLILNKSGIALYLLWGRCHGDTRPEKLIRSRGLAEWLRNGYGMAAEPTESHFVARDTFSRQNSFTLTYQSWEMKNKNVKEQQFQKSPIWCVWAVIAFIRGRFTIFGELSWSWWFGRLRTEWLLPKENHQNTCKTRETSWKRKLPKENDLSEYSRNTCGMVILTFTFLV